MKRYLTQAPPQFIMRTRLYLLKLQHKMHDRVRNYARRFLGSLTPSLKRYYADYRRSVKGFEAVSSRGELETAICGSDIVLCGDFHTLKDAQSNVVELLEGILGRLPKKITLALEMLPHDKNEEVERFLRGRLDQTSFLEEINFQKTWGFDWENYRVLFDFARRESLNVIGLNLSHRKKFPSLAQRDRFAATKIAEASKEGTLVVVLIGDLHLASNHLPQKLAKELREPRKILTLYQNVEEHYWTLSRKGLDHLVDVVKVREGAFSLLTTPPWKKIQTHIQWAEQMSENENFPDLTDELREYLQLQSEFLRLAVPREEFTVATPNSLQPLSAFFTRSDFTKDEIKFLGQLFEYSPSHYIPRAGIIWLSSAQTPTMPEESLRHLHAVTTGFDRIFQTPKDDFYAFVWVKALSVIGAKMVHHNYTPNPLRRPVNRLLQHYESSQTLGLQLGEALFHAMVENTVSREELRELFMADLNSENRNARLYREWTDRLDSARESRVKRVGT